MKAYPACCRVRVVGKIRVSCSSQPMGPVKNTLARQASELIG